jgi:hypothetical protein
LISNDSNVNSYEIAQQAKFVFTFRSSLSAEFSMVGINCFQTAPTAWSRYSDIEPIVSKEDMHRVLTERVNKNKHILKDWEAFAMYYAMQGTPFESMKLNLESELVSQNGQSFVQELSGLRLDIPKLPRRGKRNYR